MPGELSTHCSLGFVQIDAGKEREHHEDRANCVRFQCDFFSNKRVSNYLFDAMTIFRRRWRNRMLWTARNRMPTPKSCSEHCKEQLCNLVVRKFIYWLASICPSNTLDQFVVANFTSFHLTKSILLEMAVYNMQFKLVLNLWTPLPLLASSTRWPMQ